MNDFVVLTPYFLDEPVETLEGLAEVGWLVNKTAAWTRHEEEPSAAERQERMLAIHRPLAEAVAKAIGDGRRPVSIAGDCCATIPVLAGLQRAGVNPTLIWFDAHGDFNDWHTTPSGFLGGMPLAMLVGRGEQTLVEGNGLTPLPEAQVILTDARDLDPGEREAVEDSAVRHLPRVEMLLEMPLPAGPLYVHFDCDVLDTAEAPAVSYPAPGGPSADSLRRVFQHLAASGKIAAVSLTTWTPQLDEDGRTQNIVLELLQELL